MKKLLFGCLGLIVVLILAAVIGIMSLPSTVVVERSRTVNATPEEVYAVVSDLHTWPDWTFWSKEADPDCTWDFQGETGDGASMAWEGPIHGKGKLTLKNCVPGQQVEYDMVFIEESMASVGSMTLAADGEGTTVTWTMSQDLEGAGKLLGLAMDGLIGPMFDQGLVGLDAHLGG